MPCRIDSTRRTVRRALILHTAATLLGWLVSGSDLRAAPFEVIDAMPSVLASPADEATLSDAVPVQMNDGSSWDGMVAGTSSSDITAQVVGNSTATGVTVTDYSDFRLSAPGLLQGLFSGHDTCHRWVGNVDSLVLWRDAPPVRPIIQSGDGLGAPLLDANQLQSTATGGVRGSLLRLDGCSGNGWELAYLYAGTFTAQSILPFQDGFPYALSPPGIYGNRDSQPFDSGTATLLAQLQSAELNRLVAEGPNFRWLAGFRWLQWNESFTLRDTLDDGTNLIDDLYDTRCYNNLYGGQIGLNALLFALPWLRFDSVVKAGAYYNDASQTSVYTTTDPAFPGTASVSVGQSPASCSFVGEVGLTGALPITSNLDFRFGYIGLFITGLAQPTQQLSGQQLTPGFSPVGTLTATGGTIVQGLTLGLEGRW